MKISTSLLLASTLMMAGNIPALNMRPVPIKKPCRRKLCGELTNHKKGYCSPECKKGLK